MRAWWGTWNVIQIHELVFSIPEHPHVFPPLLKPQQDILNFMPRATLSCVIFHEESKFTQRGCTWVASNVGGKLFAVIAADNQAMYFRRADHTHGCISDVQITLTAHERYHQRPGRALHTGLS